MSQASILFDVPGPKAKRRHLTYSVVGGVALMGLFVWLLFFLWDNNQITPEKWEPFLRAAAWTDFILPGLWATLVAAFWAIIISFILGLAGALARMSDYRIIRWPASVLIEFFRAVPVLIMMIFALNLLLNYVSWVGSGIRPLVAVVIGLSLYNGSVIAEVIRNGVASIPNGQREAGLSVGLTPAQVRRSILVPQALTAMLPTLVSQLVVILKDSALGYIILYPELLRAARNMGPAYGNILVAFIVVAAMFITINWCLTKTAEYLERRLRERGRTAGKVGSAELLEDDSAAPGSAADVDAGGRRG